jgi:hypothetical protein
MIVNSNNFMNQAFSYIATILESWDQKSAA